MTEHAVHRPAHRVRRGGVRGALVADIAVVRRGRPAVEMAPRAVRRAVRRAGLGNGVPSSSQVGARRCFVVAGNAVVLPVAVLAALAVRRGREPVAARAPEARVVLRKVRGMALDAVVPAVAGEAGLAALPRAAAGERYGPAVVPQPVAPVGVRPGEGDPPVSRLRCRSRCWCRRSCWFRNGRRRRLRNRRRYRRRCSRSSFRDLLLINSHDARREGRGKGGEKRSAEQDQFEISSHGYSFPRNHTASPVSRSGSPRSPARTRMQRSARGRNGADTSRSRNRSGPSSARPARYSNRTYRG